jgi:hypothetical protein
MAETLITHFDPDPTLLEPLREATEYQPWNPEGQWSPDWPGNILSKRIVLYGDGTIARRDDPVQFAVDPAELALCRRLAAEAKAIVEDLMIAGSSNEFRSFYNTASARASAPTRIDAELIQTRFGGTIFRLAEVAVEPMAETGDWWVRVAAAFARDPGLEQYKAMIRWFQSRPEFVDTAYVRIGDNLEMANSLPDAPEVETYGVVMPRLAVGLTRAGSLAGLAGCVVMA